MSKSWIVITLLLAVAMPLFPIRGSAAQPEMRPAELVLKTERVVVFKDGYCMVIKNGTAKTDDEGRVFTEEVPDAAVLGSFWAVPLTEGLKLRSTVAGWEESRIESEIEVDCQTTFEVLQENIGKIGTFTCFEKEYSGEILKVLLSLIHI